MDPDSTACIYADNGAVEQVLKTRETPGTEQYRVYYGFTGECLHFTHCVSMGHLPRTHLGDTARTMELAQCVCNCQM